ncbi:MATE family efflux transporter, partial [Finegoldia magna]|uniref:MATE family efflux transporter n=1 Tax=Finegoldia magna TaxID=1260 RepID=UPI0029025949
MIIENLNEQRSNLLGNESIPKLIWKFSVPATVGMLVQALYNVVDRIFLGAGVNQMSIGGVYLMFPIFLFLMAFGMLIGVGGNSLSSIKFGEGKKKESEIILGTSIFLSIIFGVLISAIFLLNLKWFLKIFGASDTLMPYAYEYGKIILYGAPFQMVGFAMNNFIRGEGNPRAAMVTMF